MALEYGEDGIHIHVHEVRYQYLISQGHWHIESVYSRSHISVGGAVVSNVTHAHASSLRFLRPSARK